MDFSDIHRMFHQIATEYSSGIHWIFAKIDHTFNHIKKKTSKYWRKYTLYIKYLFQPQWNETKNQ